MKAPPRSFQNALKWAYLGNWGDKAFSALFTFILAGVLGPHEFGIVSICAIYVGLLQMFLDQGLATALIQRKDLEPEHLDAVFWTNLGCSIVLVLISLTLAGRWAAANHSPEAGLIIPVLSVSIILESLSIVQVSILNREMDFRSLTIRSNASIFVSGIVGIAMALGGCGVWSLVAQQLLRDTLALILLWRLSPWRPRFGFSWRHLRELLKFSVPNFVAKLGIFVDYQATSVALGMLFGPTAVGLYRVAEKVTWSVITVASSAAQSVSLPEFARHQSDPAKLRETGLSCVRLAATVTVPALAGMAVVSSPLMATIGPAWLAASNVLKILCVSGIFIVLTFFTGPLLQALGRTRELAVLEWSRTIVGLAFLAITAHFVRNVPEYWQIIGIPLARLATALSLIVPAYLYFYLKLCGLRLRDFLGAIRSSAITAVCIVAAVLLFQSTGWLQEAKPAFLLAVEVAVGGLVGLPILLRLDSHLRGSVYAQVQRIRSWGAKPSPPGQR